MRTYVVLRADAQAACYFALGIVISEVRSSQTRAGAAGGCEALVAALQACTAATLIAGQPAALLSELNQRWGEAMFVLVQQHPANADAAVAAGAIEAIVTHLCALDSVPVVFDWGISLLQHCLAATGGRDARAVSAGALEALEARAGKPCMEPSRLQVIRDLQPAAQRHDAAPCAVAGCKRCTAARNSGVMCALPGCGARTRADGKKKLLRCGTCRAACYCGPAHQREDWGRHKGACGTPPRDDGEAAVASDS